MLASRRRLLLLSAAAMAFLTLACSDPPTAAPSLITTFSLSEVAGHATPAVITAQHETVLDGSLSLAPDGTGTFFYALLPVIPGDRVQAVDPLGESCDFTWKARAARMLILECAVGSLDTLVLSESRNGSVTLSKFGVQWTFTPERAGD